MANLEPVEGSFPERETRGDPDRETQAHPKAPEPTEPKIIIEGQPETQPDYVPEESVDPEPPASRKPTIPEIERYITAYEEEFKKSEKDDIALKCEKLFSDNAEDITEGMIDLALHCSDDRVRFQAQRYVLDNLVFPKTHREGGREDFSKLLERISG